MTTRAATKGSGSEALSKPADAAEMPDIVSKPTQQDEGLIGALRAACSIANVKFTDAKAANDLLV